MRLNLEMERHFSFICIHLRKKLKNKSFLVIFASVALQILVVGAVLEKCTHRYTHIFLHVK